MKTVFEDDILRVVEEKNLLVAGWFDAPDVEHMRIFRRCSQALKQRNPDGTAMANVIVSGTPRFSSEVRAEAAEQTRLALHNLGAAHIVLVPGLTGSAVRAFLGTMILLGRAKNPTRVFGDIDEGSRWLESQLAAGVVGGWSAPIVRAACEEAAKG